MAYVLILLAVVLFVAGLWLLRPDASLPGLPALPALPVTETRQAWAKANGFSYAKTDESLTGEWRRGAASAGAAATKVASGVQYGHDTYIADLGSTTVIAMTTGEASDVVVDMRRTIDDTDTDLHLITEVEGFRIFGTDTGPIQRFIDVRVSTALEQMPAAVEAVWFEADWVVAQLAHGAKPSDWHAAFAPLGLLADAARTLPPASPRGLAERGFEVGVDKQKLLRPEVELPTRVTGTTKGEVDPREVGADDVAPIVGDSRAGDLTRAPRMQQPPSIFEEDTHE
ncbi:hypothetical protein QP446_11530 [Corynebacterium riegelii]|uniref:hypothetical protein n=1 Tax=Corynebacterium riegelii TaxID=156976 RepID=UPI00254BCF84|nr:hypothetical protein [Corynebacterium riegelii]MDK7181381.1 hypothetical protein [Corynebacterium riegelii]